MEEFVSHFAEVADPRARNARHDFPEVIFVAVTAVPCGAEDCTDMALFARSKLDLLRQVVKLEHGPPRHDTFSRVFRPIAPEPFEAAFAGEAKGVVAIDGKALRGACERGRKATPLHLVNVRAAEAKLVIGQRLAPGRNEAPGARQAPALLGLEGCIVAADALHCRPTRPRPSSTPEPTTPWRRRPTNPACWPRPRRRSGRPIRMIGPSTAPPSPMIASKAVSPR